MEKIGAYGATIQLESKTFRRVGWVDGRKPNIINFNAFVGLRCRLTQPTCCYFFLASDF
ncbi:hypothetical protein B6N60_02070 [Richelia sinica FACHB-800]|uniref:Uncharacterized protein n=1 Tax=Richelia sinica FACHB-800 TaxID=1357546 RepID=A0A975T7A4_9NOST|nr:hypothetical protein B6N60_02070 [Richelia sinica FACHB-800]